MRELQIGTARLELVHGNIVSQDTEAIVNAANAELRGGGGVDGAIHAACGPGLLAECIALGGCPTGEARLTGAGRLPVRFVLHAVGPVYRDGRHGEAALLASAYRWCFELANGAGIRSLAFPSISTGAYRYPVADASRIALETTLECLSNPSSVSLVRFVLFSPADLHEYECALFRAARLPG